ncbi:MAG: hypothetical protein ACOYB8_03735 [Eubacteriaceae bacterium]|jgi:hypothetical protein
MNKHEPDYFDRNDFQSWALTESGASGSRKGTGSYILLVLGCLAALTVFILGLSLLADPSATLENRAVALVAAAALIGIFYFFIVVTHTALGWLKAFSLAVMLPAGAFAVWYFPSVLDTGYRIVCGSLGLVIALLVMLNVIREKYDGVPFAWDLFASLTYTTLSIVLLFSPDGSRLATILTGIYLMLFSIDIFFDCIVSLFRLHPHLKRRFSMSFPTIIASFLPNGFYSESLMLAQKDPGKLVQLEKKDPGKEPDLIVYVHTRAGLQPGFGHCDLCFENKVYSYGEYDLTTYLLHGFFAAGVLGLIPPQKQIEFALKHSKKILIAYGLTLDPEHKTAVREKIRQIQSQTYPWKTDAQLAQEGKLHKSPESCTDIASLMYLQEGTTFSKFRHGSEYETYNGTGMNCAEFVNDIVSQSGIELFKFDGLITPGTYLEYLDTLYTIGGSIVTDRRLYRMQSDRIHVIPMNSTKPLSASDLTDE